MSLFSPHIPDYKLSGVCRNLATLLEAGVPILQALRTASKNASHPRVKEALGEITLELKTGNDFASALEENPRFPPLAAEMMGVAERTGQLPEILRGLADHYENLVRTRRQFYLAIAWPMFQLIAAIFVVAAMILVIGMIGTKIDGEPLDVLGIGLVGSSGAMIWLFLTLGTLVGLWLLSQFLSASVAGQKVLDSVILRIPVIGACARSYAISRFSWAMALTQQTGMGLDECCTVSLKASSNGAFIAEIPRVVAMVRAGEELTVALAATHLFPQDYLQTIDVADASGTVPETLHRISPELEADAKRKLTALAVLASGFVWMTVAAFIIFLIIRLMMFYVGTIYSAMPDP